MKIVSDLMLAPPTPAKFGGDIERKEIDELGVNLYT